MPRTLLVLVLGLGGLACATPVPRPTASLQTQTPTHPVVQASARLQPTPRLGHATPAELHTWARRHGALRRNGALTVGQVALFGPAGGTARWAGRVERVDRDGTVLLVMALPGPPVRLRMNLQHPQLRRHLASHRVLNHYLEAGHTTAQLYLGNVRLPSDSTLVADAR